MSSKTTKDTAKTVKDTTKDDINKFFQIIKDGVNEDNQDAYALLRTSKVDLGDVFDLFTGLNMMLERAINQATQDITILQYIAEDISKLDVIKNEDKDLIKKSIKRYEDAYKAVSDAMDEQVKANEEAKKG